MVHSGIWRSAQLCITDKYMAEPTAMMHCACTMDTTGYNGISMVWGGYGGVLITFISMNVIS